EARQGERVVAMPKGAHGGFAEYAICPSISAFAMPGEIPLPDAAALYSPFHLAWLGLFDRAELRSGETVLIHAAAGGSGSAAIQLAVHAGARVIATAGGAEKVALCRELGAHVAIDYRESDFAPIRPGGTGRGAAAEKVSLCRELGAHVAIDYRERDFAPIVLEETGNRGVDVVFDNVGEAVMDASIKCIAYNGRYLMMGFASDKKYVDEKLIVPRQIAAGNFKLCGVLLAYAPPAVAQMMKKGMGWNFASDALGARITREIAQLVLAKHVKPVIGRVVEFEDL